MTEISSRGVFETGQKAPQLAEALGVEVSHPGGFQPDVGADFAVREVAAVAQCDNLSRAGRKICEGALYLALEAPAVLYLLRAFGGGYGVEVILNLSVGRIVKVLPAHQVPQPP